MLLDRAPTWALQMLSVARPHMREKLRQQVLGATRERMLRELVEALDALAALQPVVLVLEDLHWSDHSTVDLLAPVARRREPARLLVIGTYRPADARTRAHPIHTTAQELRLRGLASEVALASFRETDVEAYLRSRLNGHELPDDLPRLLVERTGGNPLFLEKVVDAWIEHGLVRRDERGWRAVADRDDLTRAIPETLRELITQRLSEVSEEDRQILEAASVAALSSPLRSSPPRRVSRRTRSRRAATRLRRVRSSSSLALPMAGRTERFPPATASRTSSARRCCTTASHQRGALASTGRSAPVSRPRSRGAAGKLLPSWLRTLSAVAMPLGRSNSLSQPPSRRSTDAPHGRR